MPTRSILMRCFSAVKFQRVRFVLAAGVLTLTLSGVLAFALIQRGDIKKNFEARSDSLNGLVFQFERESLRLRQAMLEQLRQPEHIDRDLLTLRNDILSSRLELVKNSPTMWEVASTPEYTSVISSMDDFNRSMDAAMTVHTLNPVDLTALLRTLYELEMPIQTLSRVATMTTQRTMEASSLRLLTQNALILGLTLIQLLFLALATLAISNRRKQRLIELNVLQMANKQLKHNEEKLTLAANVFKHARESIIIADSAGMIREINENFCKETQYTQADLLGQHVTQLFCPASDTVDTVDQLFQTVGRDGHWLGELINQRKDGSEYPAMVSVSAVLSND